MIKKFDEYINEGVYKMTPRSQDEILQESPNFVELYNDVKQWTKDCDDIKVGDIEFNIYSSVSYAYFKIYINGETPIDEIDRSFDKNVLLVVCYSPDQIALSLKRKYVYQWENLLHYADFPDIIREINKLRTNH